MASSTIDYLKVERALSGTQPIDELNADEKDFYQRYQEVFDLGRMAHRWAQGYYSHVAAMQLARDPRAKEFERRI